MKAGASAGAAMRGELPGAWSPCYSAWGGGAACCVTDHHAWVRIKEELVTSPLSSRAKNSNPANMTVAFWIPFQH